jgi:hypothetical protein
MKDRVVRGIGIVAASCALLVLPIAASAQGHGSATTGDAGAPTAKTATATSDAGAPTAKTATADAGAPTATGDAGAPTAPPATTATAAPTAPPATTATAAPTAPPTTTAPTTPAEATATTTPAATTGVAAEEQPEEKRHEPLFLGLDFTLGFGRYAAALEQDIQPPNNLVPRSVIDDTTFRTATFIILGHYKFKNFGIGLRMPLISGHIDSEPAQSVLSQDLFTSGNLELSMDMAHKLSDQMRLIPEVALTFPTSPGSTPPYTEQELDANPPSQSLQDQYHRYAVGLAAAFARGGEDDALFFNWRLGVTPKATLDMKFGHSHLQPYVKIPIMFGLEQSPGAEEVVRVEAVGAVRFLQDIGPVHLGLRVVGMVPIAARTSLKTPMLSVWPEFRLQITPSAQFWLAGMIPLAGDFSVFTPYDPVTAPYGGGKNGSFEAGLGATF